MGGYYVLISPAGEAPALQDSLHHRQLGIGEHDAGIARIDPFRTAVATFVLHQDNGAESHRKTEWLTAHKPLSDGHLLLQGRVAA